MKKLIITIDTEGDNLWEWKPNKEITTNNALYLQRFQDLCNIYNFKPVWLTNYEMIMDDNYVDFISNVIEHNQGEIGMHLHAWNSLPEYKIKNVNGEAPYLIEYPIDIMEQKIDYLTALIKKKVGVCPISHRAGRWATNDNYFDLLIKYGYKVDCSVTPGISWENNPGGTYDSKGTDYTDYSHECYWIENKNKTQQILEVPVSVFNSHKCFIPQKMSLKKILGSMYRGLKGENLWLRPDGHNNKQMLYMIDKYVKSNQDYIMFMIHSSELMPGGSPTFKTKESIEELYHSLEEIFQKLAQNFYGVTLEEYYNEKKEKK